VDFAPVDAVAWREDLSQWNQPGGTVMAGAGSLGSALLGYEQLNSHGMQIVAAFDIDPEKIGRQIQGRGVRPFAPLPAIVGRAAQSVTTPKVTRGIRAGGNSAPAHMPVPERVIPQNDDLLSLNRSTAMGKRNQLCRK
jgi:redox-sensing transcriptional repressor